MMFSLFSDFVLRAPPGTARGATEREELAEKTLVAAKRGDPGALEVFVKTYENRIHAFVARSTGRGPHVEDLAQEIFLKAFIALPRFEARSGAKLSSWLLSIASRHLADERKKKRPFATATLDELAAPHPDPESLVARKDLGRAIERAALELSPDFREAFILQEFHGMSLVEIGETLGIRPETAKTRVARAREHLRNRLRESKEDER